MLVCVVVVGAADGGVGMREGPGPGGGGGAPAVEGMWVGGSRRKTAEGAAVVVRRGVVSPAAMVWGVTLPWNLLVSVALGLWLMFAPSTLGSTGSAAHSYQLFGDLIVTVAGVGLAGGGGEARGRGTCYAAEALYRRAAPGRESFCVTGRYCEAAPTEARTHCLFALAERERLSRGIDAADDLSNRY